MIRFSAHSAVIVKNWENDSLDENKWKYHFIPHLCAEESKHCHSADWSTIREVDNTDINKDGQCVHASSRCKK